MSSQIQLRRLAEEIRMLREDPIHGITIIPNEDDISSWDAVIVGPEDTPYEGGNFEMRISFTSEFPFRPPKVEFKTRIFHPNVNLHGSICLDILRDKWAASLTIQKVLLSIVSLLASPNPDDPLMPEIAIMYKENFPEYNRIAKEWTAKYAS